MVTMQEPDSVIQAEVLAALQSDPDVDVSEIGVTVDHDVVTLRGTVDGATQKTAAERAALRVAGVRAIANDLVLRAEASRAPSDTEIAKGVVGAFERNSTIPHGIVVHVEKGRVTLSGNVPWPHQRVAAEKTAAAVAGVVAVTNFLTATQRSVATEAIEREIRRALIREAEDEATRIHVALMDGQVTLSGTVRSLAERREAEAAARRVAGVTRVINAIAVQP